MPPPYNERLETLYRNLTADGYELDGPEKLKTALDDGAVRKTFYDNLTADGYELDGYDGFFASLGYDTANGISDALSSYGKKIAAGAKETAGRIAAIPSELADTYSELGPPRTEEEAFNFVHRRELTELSRRAEREFFDSDDYKRIERAMADDPKNREKYESEARALYENSPGAKRFADEANRMALEWEADKDPILRIRLLAEEKDGLLKEIAETEKIGELSEQSVRELDPIFKERYKKRYEERALAETDVRNRIKQINRQLSPLLNRVADEGLNHLDYLEQSFLDEIEELEKIPSSKRTRFQYVRFSRMEERRRAIETARNFFSKLKNIANADIENNLKSLWQGISDNIGDSLTDILTLGTSNIQENLNISSIAEGLDVAERANKKPKDPAMSRPDRVTDSLNREALAIISPEERYLLETYGLYSELANAKDLPTTYNVGQAFIESLPFMAEIASTGGLRSAVSKSVSKAVANSAAKAMPKLSSKVAGAAAKATGYAAGAVAAAPVMPMTYKTASERQLGNYHIDSEGNVTKSERAESFAESFGLASLDTFVTLAAEDGIGPFALGARYGAKGVGKALGLTKGVKASGKMGAYIAKLKKNVRWNGYFSEIGEEYDEKLIKTLIMPPTAAEADDRERTGAGRWDGFFDGKELLEIAGSVGLTQLLLSAPAKVDGYYRSGKAKVDLKKVRSDLPSAYAERLVRAMNLPTAERRKAAINDIDFSGIDAAGMIAVAKYVLAKTRYDMLRGKYQGEREAEELERADGFADTVAGSGGVIVTVEDGEGNRYYTNGDVLSAETAIIVSAETGESRQVASKSVKVVEQMPTEEFRAIARKDILERLEAEGRKSDLTEANEEISETPDPRVAELRRGDMVMVDGVEVELEYRTENGWLINGPTGLEEVSDYDIELPPVEEAPIGEEAPRAERRTYGNIEVGVIANGDGTFTIEETYDNEKDANRVAKAINDKIGRKVRFTTELIESDDPLEPDTYKVVGIPIARREDASDTENNSETPSVTEAAEAPLQTSAPEDARIRKKETPFQARIRNVADSVADLRSLILYGIAVGRYRFRWKSTRTSRGLGEETGYGEAERKGMIGLLKNDGYTPESLAEHIWMEEYNASEDVDTQEIHNEILDVLRTVTSRTRALEELERRAGIAYAPPYAEEVAEVMDRREAEEVAIEATEYYSNLLNLALEYGADPDVLKSLVKWEEVEEYVALLEQDYYLNERNGDENNTGATGAADIPAEISESQTGSLGTAERAAETGDRSAKASGLEQANSDSRTNEPGIRRERSTEEDTGRPADGDGGLSAERGAEAADTSQATGEVPADRRAVSPYLTEAERAVVDDTYENTSKKLTPIGAEAFEELIELLNATGLAEAVVTDKAEFDRRLRRIRRKKAVRRQVREDREGNPIGDGSYHVNHYVFEFEDYPQVRANVDYSKTTESVYVTYKNIENGKAIVVRFSDHINNAAKFGDQLDGNFASADEILFHLGLKKREFTPNKRLMIRNRTVAKKELASYEEADKTIQELYALGANANISEYKGKLAKGSRYLILGDKVEEREEQKPDGLGGWRTIGKFTYSDLLSQPLTDTLPEPSDKDPSENNIIAAPKRIADNREAVNRLKDDERKGYIDTGVDNADGRRVILIPRYETRWDYAENSDPDVERFDSYDEAIADIKEPGSFSDVDEYFEPTKTAVILFDEGYLNEDGDVEVEREAIRISDIDEELIPRYIRKLVIDSDDIIGFNEFANPNQGSRELEENVYDNINDDIIKEYGGFRIASPSKGKYRAINIYRGEERVGSITLRISDHPYNPANNDADAKAGRFISVEIFEKDKTGGRFGGRYSLRFDKSSAYADVVDAINERIAEIIDERFSDIRYARTSDGTVYGFVDTDGTVYIDPTRMNANTPIHEFGHLWISFIERNNPELYQRGVELISESPYMDMARNNPAYTNLSEKRQIDEAMAMAIGDRGEAVVNEKGLGPKLLDWIREVWYYLADTLGLRRLSSSELQNLTLERFIDGAVADLLKGDRIKSPTDSIGTFDGSSADIRYQSEPIKDTPDDTIDEKARKYAAILSGDAPPQLDMMGADGKRVARILGLTKGDRALDARFREAVYKFADSEVYVKALQELIEKSGGRTSDETDVYNEINLSIGRSSMLSEKFEREEIKALMDAARMAMDKVRGIRKWTDSRKLKPVRLVGLYFEATRLRRDRDRNRPNVSAEEAFERRLGVSPSAFLEEFEGQLGDEAARSLRTAVAKAAELLPDKGFTWKNKKAEDRKPPRDTFIDKTDAVALYVQARYLSEGKANGSPVVGVRSFTDETGLSPEEYAKSFEKEVGKTTADAVYADAEGAMNTIRPDAWRWREKTPYEGQKIGDYQALSLYLQAKDIVDAEAFGLPDRGRDGFTELTETTPERYIADYESELGAESVKELWKKVKDATSFGLKRLLDAEMLTREKYDEYMKRDYYVPQRGWNERDMDDARPEYLKGYGGSFYGDSYNAVLKRARGRESLASDPIPYIRSMGHSAIVSAEKNGYKRKALRLVMENLKLGRRDNLFDLYKTWYVKRKDSGGNVIEDHNGAPIWDEVFARPAEELFERDRETNRKLDELKEEAEKAYRSGDAATARAKRSEIEELRRGLNIATSVNRDAATKRTKAEQEQHYVSVWEGGKRYLLYFADERVANGINKADIANVSGYARAALGGLNRRLAALHTSKNPAFAATNFIRDFLFAFFGSGIEKGARYTVRFVRNLSDPRLSAAIARRIAKKPNADKRFDRMLSEFFEDGAATGYAYLKDLDNLKRKINGELDRSKLRRIMDSSYNPLKWTKDAIAITSDAFVAITEYSELLNRFAIYVTSVELGESRRQAAIDAKNVTVNFNRRGAANRDINALYMFFNATIQGTMRGISLAQKHKGKFAAVAAVFLVSGFLNNMFMIPDDDDENDRWSEFDRMNNIVIGNAKIPLPHFFRAFWAMGATTALAVKGEKSAGSAIYGSLKGTITELVQEQFNPLEYFEWDDKSGSLVPIETAFVKLIPSALRPLGEVATNEDFVGRSIYRRPIIDADRIPHAFWSKNDIAPFWKELSFDMLEAGGGSRNSRTVYNPDTGKDVPALYSWYHTNPEVMEHLFTSWTGGVGKFFNDLYRTAYNAGKGEFDAATVPVLNRLTKPYDEDKAFAKRFYRLVEKSDDYLQAVKAYEKGALKGNGAASEKDKKRYRAMIKSEGYGTAMKVKSINRILKKIERLTIELEADPNAELSEKLRKERSALIRRAEELLGEAEKKRRK